MSRIGSVVSIIQNFHPEFRSRKTEVLDTGKLKQYTCHYSSVKRGTIKSQ